MDIRFADCMPTWDQKIAPIGEELSSLMEGHVRQLIESGNEAESEFEKSCRARQEAT